MSKTPNNRALIAGLALWAGGCLAPGLRAAEVEAYLVADNQTGHILESKAPNEKRQIGSLTKIATAMVVLDWAEKSGVDLGRQATVPPPALHHGGANPLGLQPGDQLSLRDLLYATLLASDNAAAYTLADHVGRALPAVSPAELSGLAPVDLFVAQMNALARTLKMTRTLFLNPHGLDSEPGAVPYSTAADMARLARYAMAKGSFRFYVSQVSRQITVSRGGQSLPLNLQNTNQLLGVDEIDGVKTGRTRKAGDCIILSSGRSPETRQEGNQVMITPRRITVVVLGATDRMAVGGPLIRRGWQLYDDWAARGRQTNPKQSL